MNGDNCQQPQSRMNLIFDAPQLPRASVALFLGAWKRLKT
jgi:hypothetical protein